MEKPQSRYGGAYWEERSDLIYYRVVDYLVRCVGAKATSIIDVGTGKCPYLEWFHWIEKKTSIDIIAPYASETVEAIYGNILTTELPQKFDLCLCLQVLEHVQDPAPFARRLTELGKRVIVSVPYNWPPGQTPGHVQDPVDLDLLSQWFGRRPNYHIIVQEPLRTKKHERLIAIYDADPKRRFGGTEIQSRIMPLAKA